MPIPWETMPGEEGPAGRAHWGAYIQAMRGNAHSEPGIITVSMIDSASLEPLAICLLVQMNRERELSLDRRETG